MDMGTHDPLRGIDREAMLSRRVEHLESYGIMPEKLAARGDRGWLDDGDRDSRQAAKLAELVKDMDATCAEILAREVSSGQLELRALARRWQAIRRITQSNQTNEGEQ